MSISDDRVAPPEGVWESHLDVRESVRAGAHTLALNGELDLANAPQVEAALGRVCENGTRAVTLDLSGVTFMGSTGLRLVLHAKELCDANGWEFRVVPGPVNVQRVFEITGLGNAIPFERRR